MVVRKLPLALILLLFFITFLCIFARLSSGIAKGNKSSQPVLVDNQARLIAVKCKGVADWNNCYSRELSARVVDMEYNKVLEILGSMKELDERIRDCHFIAHDISRALSLKSGYNWEEQLKMVNSDCRGGFIHGLIEAKSISDLEFKIDASIISSVCKQIRSNINPNDPVAEQACAHTMGHILVTEFYGDLQKAIEVCNQTPEEIRYLCNSGIFMENITKSSLIAHGLSNQTPINWDSAFAQEQLCQKNSGQSIKACWREIAHIYLNLASNNLKDATVLCLRALSQEYQDACILHAVALSAPSVSVTDNELKDLCSFFSYADDKHKACINEVVTALIYTSLDFEKKAESFCNLQTGEYRDYCESRLKYMIKNASFKIEE